MNLTGICKTLLLRIFCDMREHTEIWCSRLVFLIGPWMALWMVETLNENNVFTDLACNNEVKVDGTYITLTGRKAQSGTAYITVGYTKPSGGYYTGNQFYKENTGAVCTGWYASSSKTVVGPCYCGMIVGLNTQINYLAWTTFCLSLLRETVEGMSYRYQTDVASLQYGDQTWYYSVSQVEQSFASSTTIDNTQPPDRRFYIGAYTGDFVTQALTALLDSIYT